ncbi:MAG TPA: FHA domain-containing protein [Propionicimonas sp.]|jgi:pSer/pThr/pTyr-binding forkhead associated (FHA) protein|nr:FHA domain-containing protein [Propionicimonas sp.]
MSELVVLGLKLGFLALLWLFILFTGNVIRTDLFGRKVPAAELVAQPPVGAPRASQPRLSRRALKQLPHTLTVTHGKQAGLQLPLEGGVLIGRSSDCQLLLDDDYVSTRHARITLTATGYQVEDLGSTNGTFVNNQRLTQPTPFGPGDTLRIGRTLMIVEK